MMAEQLVWQEFRQMDEAARRKALTSLGETVMVETAVFQQTCDLLSYHNQLDDLIHLLNVAYAKIKAGNNSSEWQQQTIITLLVDSYVFQYLESGLADKAAAPPKLVETLQVIVPIDADGLNRYLAHLSGYTQYQWQLEHLAEHPPQNMAALLIEFLAFAWKKAEIAHGRTNLMRQLLPTYFVERRTGQLNPRQDIGDLMRRGRPIPKPPASYHPLVPDAETLQRFLAKLLNYDPVRPYVAAALFTLLPTWLRFLQVRQLLDPTEAAATLNDLSGLKVDLQTYFADFAGDDELKAALADWPEG